MDSSSFKELITCEKCSETFGEGSKCPRMLSCGHSFCHSCLEILLVENPSCPNCKTGFLFKKIELIPINFSLKSLLDIECPVFTPIETENADVQGAASVPYASISNPGTSSRRCLSVGHCTEHGYNKELRCMNCEAWICGRCASLTHKDCRTISIKEAYEELRLQVENELGKKKTSTETLTESMKVLDEEKKSVIQEISRKKLEIKMKTLELKDREKRLQELESQKSAANIFCDKLKQFLEIDESSSNDSEFSNNINEVYKLLEEEKKKGQEAVQYANIPQTREALDDLCRCGSVYAMEDRYNGQRYGKVSVKDGWIWVDHFEPRVPNAANLFDFKKLLFQFSGTTELPKTAFIQLTPERDEGNAVQIVIETDGRSPRAKNFVLLCSALRGSSYLKLPLVKYNHFPHFKEINPGPPPVLEGIRNYDPRIPVKKSGVYGMFDSSSWFRIQLKNNPFYSYKFGSVVSGLQNLRKLKADCSVTECGLVI